MAEGHPCGSDKDRTKMDKDRTKMDKDRTETKFKFSIIILAGSKFSGMGGSSSVLLDSNVQARNGPEKYPGGRVLDEVTVHGIFYFKTTKIQPSGGYKGTRAFFLIRLCTMYSGQPERPSKLAHTTT